jgi:chemotaxis protein methyltransferase CheR
MISPTDYTYLSQYLLQKSGLALGAGKDYLLEARLVPLAQSWGLQGIDDLVREMKKGSHQRLNTAVVEAMTTNETLFFRDKTPFDELKDTLLPSLLANRQTTRRLRIWCAAASTGQEPYTLAMVLREHFPKLSDWTLEIVGTDLSSHALKRAEEAVYTQFEVQRGLPIQFLMKYFEQAPTGWRVRNELRQLVKLQQMNLLDSFNHLGQFDIVFCRNVLIYFENPAKKLILDRMAKLLRPDGYLILGAAETVVGITDTFGRFKECKSAVYTPKIAVPVAAPA